MFGLEQFGPQINSGVSGQGERNANQSGLKMSSHYNDNLGFHTGGPQGSGEPYGFHQRGHPGLNQMNGFCGSHPHGQHPHLGGSFGNANPNMACYDNGSSNFGEAFNAITEEGFSQQPGAVSDFQYHGPPGGNHMVPAPCLPLDQSPNRAASFHGIPPSTSEAPGLDHQRLALQGRVKGMEFGYPGEQQSGHFNAASFPPSESDSQLLHYATGRHPVANAACFHGKPRNPPAHQSHHGTFYERFGRKMPLGLDPGPRNPTPQPRHPDFLSRQAPCSSALPRGIPCESGPSHTSVQEGVLMPGQLSHFGPGVPPLTNHMFNMQAQQPSNHRFQHYDPAYLNAAKRPRFDFPGGENCGDWTGSLQTSPGVKNHISPTTYPGIPGDYSPPVPDGFPHGPPSQHCPERPALQQRHNAAMMIKQMASRNQQQRNQRHPGLQHLGHHGDLATGHMPPGGHVGNMIPQHNFEGDTGGRMTGMDTQNLHPPQDGHWYSEVHPRGDTMPGLLGGSSGHGEHGIHNAGMQPSELMFRSGVNGMAVQESVRMPCEGHPHPQPTGMQFQNNATPMQQMQSPCTEVSLPSAPSDRRLADFAGAPMGVQTNLPFRGPQQQGTPVSNQVPVSTSQGGFHSQPEYAPAQRSSVGKLGSLSLGSFSRSSVKDSGFGQSCLAALSTACQNMIASLGAPNLNVTFGKKNGNDAKKKASPTGQECSASEYLSSEASQNVQNNVNQVDSGDVCIPSPNCSTESPQGGGGKGQLGRRKRDSEHMSPEAFYSPAPMGSPSLQNMPRGAERVVDVPQEKPLTSPSWGKGGDQPDLLSSLDSGIQSVSRSDGSSPQVDFQDDDGAGFNSRFSSNACAAESKARLTSSPKLMSRMGGGTCPGIDQPRGATQEEIHPLEILQAQIQLQRQQFNISEERPLGARNEDEDLSSHCSPGVGKLTRDPIDLDSIMAEQHAAWYGPGDKVLMGEMEQGQPAAPWEKTVPQAKEGKPCSRIALLA